MTKLNRSHGIEVGSKVKVLTSEGCKAYDDLVGTIQIVTGVHTDSNPHWDIIEVAGRGGSEGQWPSRYELVKDFNGVDGSGNPQNFTKADLKTLQRVVLANGFLGIVAIGTDGEVGLRLQSGHEPAYFDKTGWPYEDYNIVEVYDAMGSYYQAFDFAERGALLWKRVDTAKLQAIKDADAAITKAREELAKAEAARAVL